MQEFHDALLRPNGNNPVRDRASGFKKIFEILDDIKEKDPHQYFTIVETGTTRGDHGSLAYGDDGASTVIFDSCVNHIGGRVKSVDINPDNVAHCKKHVSSLTEVICMDSVEYLWSIHHTHTIDLLYLDSFDVVRENPHPSAIHHLKELAAAIKNLRPGSIVAVDDADAFFDGGKTGKAMYVREFADHVGWDKVWDGYQLIYRVK